MSQNYIYEVNWDFDDFVDKFCMKCKKIDDCISEGRWCINPIGSQFEARSE